VLLLLLAGKEGRTRDAVGSPTDMHAAVCEAAPPSTGLDIAREPCHQGAAGPRHGALTRRRGTHAHRGSATRGTTPPARARARVDAAAASAGQL